MVGQFFEIARGALRVHWLRTTLLCENKGAHSFSRLFCAKLTQEGYCIIPRIHSALMAVLRGVYVDALCRCVAQISGYGDLPALEVNIFPLQCAALAAPDAGINQQTDERPPFQRLRVQCSKDIPDLRRIRSGSLRLCFTLARLRTLYLNIIYLYRTDDGKSKQHWETYETELEAIQRKAYIELLQKEKRYDDIRLAVLDYKRRRAIEKTQRELAQANAGLPNVPMPSTKEDNTHQTFKHFMERFLPFYARKKRFSPNTYDSYVSNLNNHIYPYFGNWVMSTITAEDIDLFLDYLSQKPCSGSKGYKKKPSEVPRLSSPTIKKVFNVLMVGFPTAKQWRYVTEIPDVAPPSEKYRKRNYWQPEQIHDFLKLIEDDPMLHLAVHIGFVCSLRAGEVAGIDTSLIDLKDKSLWIKRILQRVSDESLATLPREEIIHVFPKKKKTSKSSLILKAPKTEESYRKLYLTTPLVEEIQRRLDEIADNKAVFGSEYQDQGLLLCFADGSPIEPKSIGDAFKDAQRRLKIEDMLEFQGLRKSGQMHKVRLSNNNYQLVAEAAGQSPEVLMSNYNEAQDCEKRALSEKVEESFYSPTTTAQTAVHAKKEFEAQDLLAKVQEDPDLSQQLLRLLLSSAISKL